LWHVFRRVFKNKKLMLNSRATASILKGDLFSGHLTYCESLFLSGQYCFNINSEMDKFFIGNENYSANFMAQNKPGGVSK
jgi:hypothetical protein